MRDDNLIDFLTPLRKGVGDKELENLFIEAVNCREPYYKASGLH
jgi:cyclic pyranopterin phosphate synthase